MHTGTSYSCNIYWPESEIMNGQKAFTLYSFTLGFFIPFVLILLFYFLVICKLRTVGPKNKSKEKKKSHRKVTYLVLTVITVYVMCWLPYWVGQVYITFQPPMPMLRHSEAKLTFLLLAGSLSYANSAVNPILYAFLSENFKKSFAKAFTCATGQEVNAQLHVENSVLPRHTRGSSRGPDRTKRDRMRDTFGENGDTQAFSNFVVQESQEIDLEPDHEELESDVNEHGIAMTSRLQFLNNGDKDNLLANTGKENTNVLSQPTQV